MPATADGSPERAKRRILFVDDEPRVLEGLQRMLRPQRRVWDMSFCPSGEEALLEVEKTQFDVIVSDMRMPGVDGADLLTRVKGIQPRSIRIVLSGQTNEEAARRAVPAAHQFAAKPCDPDVLRKIIDRACELRDLLHNDELAALVGGIDALPSVPSTYARLTEVLQRSDSSIAAIAEIVKKDVALSAKILQVVNSAFFGLRRHVTQVEAAVGYLGIEVIRSLALSVAAFRELSPSDHVLRKALEREQSHALRAANLCRKLFDDSARANDAFTAALLHDVGKLVLSVKKGAEYKVVLEKAKDPKVPLPQLEYEAFGSSHSEVGAYLLGIWGLPYAVVEAVARHHAPESVAQPEFDVVAGVHIADLLANEGESGDPAGVWSDEELSYLARLGIADRLDAWRDMARGEGAR